MLCIYNTYKQKKHCVCIQRVDFLLSASHTLSRCLEFVKKIIKYELSGIHPHIFKHCRIVSSSTFSYFVYISCVAPLARGEESSLFFPSIVLGGSFFVYYLTVIFFLEYNKRDFSWKWKYSVCVVFEIFLSTLRQSNSKNFEWIIYEWERSGFMWHWKWRRVTNKNQKVMNTTLSLCKYLFAFII